MDEVIRLPPETVDAILAEALARPTLGARQLVSYLAERGVVASHSGGLLHGSVPPDLACTSATALLRRVARGTRVA